MNLSQVDLNHNFRLTFILVGLVSFFTRLTTLTSANKECCSVGLSATSFNIFSLNCCVIILQCVIYVQVKVHSDKFHKNNQLDASIWGSVVVKALRY